ncbi:MAG: hypothetical protein E5X35_11640 [Mesorhizobium sp.]|uniref:hypothetical protein n=1 Tax=unclassified Mesorhizobium TaxID=325217 RepID=UPI000FCA4931|nr:MULTISPECIES: hypothetical protein [unclassified Mesorhizobium]RUV65199.1 hypothetical protein EOA85_00100 [Mesorhizobium sp. M5C.F.Ca.IN.020.29.1.1]TIM87639.1 MAG: hypothetical protein E5Y50_11425 [Mesorhizobium sp.]TIR33310.1 MAG: hypothetical protein E5X35_11640 [Mesorhizobium sp.]
MTISSSGGHAAGSTSSTEIDIKQRPELLELLGIRSIVHPDGDDATITLRTSNGPIGLSVSLSQIAAADIEIRNTAILMHYRQSMKKDAGVRAFDDLLRTAVSPAETDVYVDGDTGDRLFVLRFADDRLPLVVRQSPEKLAAILQDVADISRRTAN